MKQIKIICQNFQRKDGSGEFTKLSVGGQFLPLVLADVNKRYQVKFTKDSQAKEPVNDGVYQVAFEDKDIWIDDRKEEPIVRIRAARVMFDKRLQK